MNHEQPKEYLVHIRDNLVMLIRNKNIHPEDRDPLMYYYEAEFDPEVHSAIKSIQDSVLINFWGTVVSVYKLDVPIVLTEEEQARLRDEMREKDRLGQSYNPFVRLVRGTASDDQYNITITVALQQPIRRLDWENIEEIFVMMLALKSPGAVIKNTATGNILSDE